MPTEMARSAPRPPSGLPEVTVTVRMALLPCREPGKPPISKSVRESSGESRSNYICSARNQSRIFELITERPSVFGPFRPRALPIRI